MEYDYDQALQTETPVQSMVSLHKKLDISRYASFMQSIIITDIETWMLMKIDIV